MSGVHSYVDVDALVKRLKWSAAQGRYDGTQRTWPYLARCRALHLPIAGLATSVTYSHDEGMHACGWWKNPEYERCLHLSLAFRDNVTLAVEPHDKVLARAWCERFFGDACRFIWAESPFSERGKEMDVWHFRVFVDRGWSPIVPRGEVYTRDFTEAGWRSWSDIHGDDSRLLDPTDQP